jgi:predicted dehydrogenase
VPCKNLEELLEQDLDGIVIATPSALHAEQSIQCLKKGKAVFCQKPLGRNAAETEAVLNAAHDADLLLGVDLSYRHVTAARQLRSLVQQGELGTIFAADLVFHNAYGPDKKWFFQRQFSGGGCVIDLGIHLIDLFLWITNYPDVHVVSSSLLTKGSRLNLSSDDVEDFARASLRTPAGMSVDLSCSWNLPAGQEAIIGVTLYGTAGGASFHNVNGSFYDFTLERFRGTSRETVVALQENWGMGAIAEWCGKLQVSKRYDPSIDGISRSALLLDQIYEKGI